MSGRDRRETTATDTEHLLHSHPTGRSLWSPRPTTPKQKAVVAVGTLSALAGLGLGIWAAKDKESFDDFFENHFKQGFHDHFKNYADSFKDFEHFPKFAFDLTLLAAVVLAVVLFIKRHEIKQAWDNRGTFFTAPTTSHPEPLPTRDPHAASNTPSLNPTSVSADS